MKKIVDRFDKKLIPELPRALFEGRIEVIIGKEEAKRACAYLMTQPILGLDTETKPVFTRAPQNEVALLQVSSHDICFLFRLNYIGLPKCLLDLLRDKTITKVGLSWHDDLRQLRKRGRFRPGTFAELQEMSKEMGIIDMSLQKLYANLFHRKISKAQQLSNWEASTLTEAQQRYAATDAWACIQIYEEMMRMKEEGYEIEHIPLPEPPAPEPRPVEVPEKAEEPKPKKKKAKKEEAKPQGQKAKKEEPKPQPAPQQLTPEEQAAREERRRRREERSQYFREKARKRRIEQRNKRKAKRNEQDNNTQEG